MSHEELIPLPDDSTKLFCQGCGCKYPDLDTNKSVTSNVASDTKPKESKSKLKQKDSLENKSFIITQSDDHIRDKQRRSRFVRRLKKI